MSQTPHSTGLTSSQLEQLCQPEQLERTLHLLFYMNHWAKARERLFFADRQGLYQVKAAVLRQAYAAGAIEATTYIDGTAGFGKDMTLDLAADIAAEVVTERLAGLSDCDPFIKNPFWHTVPQTAYPPHSMGWKERKVPAGAKPLNR